MVSGYIQPGLAGSETRNLVTVTQNTKSASSIQYALTSVLTPLSKIVTLLFHSIKHVFVLQFCAI